MPPIRKSPLKARRSKSIIRAAAKGEVAMLLHNSSTSLTLVKAVAGRRRWKMIKEMGTMCSPRGEERPNEIGARLRVRMSESLIKEARGGVKDLRREIDPLDVVEDSTPRIAKTSPKSGSVSRRSVRGSGTGTTRPPALAVRQVFSFPGGETGPPLQSLMVYLEDVVTILVA